MSKNPLSDIYTKNVLLNEEKEELKKLVKKLIVILQDAINKPDFWTTRESEIRRLRGIIDDEFDFCIIEIISQRHELLSTETLNLARRRHQELLSR